MAGLCLWLTPAALFADPAGVPPEDASGLTSPTPRSPESASAPEVRSAPSGRADGEETAAGLDAPEPPEGADEPEDEWRGPRVELGYARYRFSDGHGGGGVHAVHFGGYLPTGPARLGMHGELGLRDYSPGLSSDAIVRASVVAGYQQLHGLGPVVPYAVVVGTGGVLFGKRFHSAVSHTLWGAGLEVGTDVNLVRDLWAGLSLSWIRISMRDLHWNLLMLRVRVGL